MADQQQLDLLQQGVAAWNRWRREENPKSSPDLREADLSGADFRGGADLSQVVLHETTFANVDLAGIQGLESCNHSGPSSIGLDTFFKAGGKIPESFLRGCGLPEQFITYARSLLGQAIEFYSCFITTPATTKLSPSAFTPTCRPRDYAAGSLRKI